MKSKSLIVFLLLVLSWTLPTHAQTLEWVRQLGSSTFDWSQGASADGMGNVYISGFTGGNLGVLNAGLQDAFVAKYSDQLSLPADLDGDSDVDGADFLAWQRGESPNPLSSSDLATWQANFRTGGAPIQPGDLDRDGDVDGVDFLAWQRGESSNPLSSVDLADWQANFGIIPGPIPPASTSVPEPATLLMLMLGIMASRIAR